MRLLILGKHNTTPNEHNQKDKNKINRKVFKNCDIQSVTGSEKETIYGFNSLNKIINNFNTTNFKNNKNNKFYK